MPSNSDASVQFRGSRYTTHSFVDKGDGAITLQFGLEDEISLCTNQTVNQSVKKVSTLVCFSVHCLIFLFNLLPPSQPVSIKTTTFNQ